jgi:hypothetical protein
MHFRPHGKLLQVLATRWDPATGKSRQMLVGTVPLTANELPPALVAVLDAEEQKACLERLLRGKPLTARPLTAQLVVKTIDELKRLHLALSKPEALRQIGTNEFEHLLEASQTVACDIRLLLSRFSRLGNEPVVVTEDDDQPAPGPEGGVTSSAGTGAPQ